MRAVYFSEDGNRDETLVQQALAGETDAFGALVTRYQKAMFTVALRMLGNREDAQDVTQDAFVKVYRQLGTFDPSHKFFSWMYRIQINECLNRLRARRPVEALDANVAGSGSPFDVAVAHQQHHQIEAAILRLPDEYRSVLVLRHFAEQTYDEIAAALEIPEKTVKSRLYTARQLLGEMLLGWKQLTPEMKS
ncbi:MAG: RNA polymerase sigma factor [Vicinamibacterales bacterium]